MHRYARAASTAPSLHRTWLQATEVSGNLLVAKTTYDAVKDLSFTRAQCRNALGSRLLAIVAVASLAPDVDCLLGGDDRQVVTAAHVIKQIEAARARHVNVESA